MRDYRNLDNSHAEMEEGLDRLMPDPLDFLDEEEDGLSSHDPLDMPDMFWPHPNDEAPIARPTSKIERTSTSNDPETDPNWRSLGAILDSLFEPEAGDNSGR